MFTIPAAQTGHDGRRTQAACDTRHRSRQPAHWRHLEACRHKLKHRRLPPQHRCKPPLEKSSYFITAAAGTSSHLSLSSVSDVRCVCYKVRHNVGMRQWSTMGESDCSYLTDGSVKAAENTSVTTFPLVSLELSVKVKQ